MAKENPLDLRTYSVLHNPAEVTRPSPSRPLRSGELARLAGVSRDTLRHYERQGLLPAPLRSQANYRMYSAAAVDRVRLIRGALAIGFSVEELAPLLRQRDSGGIPCRTVDQLARRKLTELDQRIAELSALRAVLARTVRSWKKQLNGSRGHPARLLEKFVAA